MLDKRLTFIMTTLAVTLGGCGGGPMLDSSSTAVTVAKSLPAPAVDIETISMPKNQAIPELHMRGDLVYNAAASFRKNIRGGPFTGGIFFIQQFDVSIYQREILCAFA